MADQSIGTRLHLLRIEVGWSIEECAYRLTLNSNRLVSPGDWQTWERAADMMIPWQCFKATLTPFVQFLQWRLVGYLGVTPQMRQVPRYWK